MRSQSESTLLRIPLEIRNQVLGYLITDQLHVILHKGALHWSICIEPELAFDLDGSERNLQGQTHSEKTWARRLRSSWGPHWRCEEFFQDRGRGKHTLDGALELDYVCKQVYNEVHALMASNTMFQITDLETLCYASTSKDTGARQLSFLHDVGRRVIANLVRLDITLRLPLSVWESIESGTSMLASPQAVAWMGIGTAIGQLQRLTKLSIWLDHDQQCSWSAVNERCILAPLLPLAKILRLVLPKLHPDLETSERHFTEDSASPFQIRRVLRQRYHAQSNEHHDPRNDASQDPPTKVIFKGDFPITLETCRFFYEPDFTSASLEEIEEDERDKWRRGVDVELWMKNLQDQLDDFSPHEYVDI
ncbi:hypothetical protein K491DRAFT_741649 [Lophiostoma macrostomum CBS 122681]|uniref:DUF7730 domain-containing protein n=1 Tax=Lophiostoma macrostomum CBS 122681 TaxID=1314788 RepID=A0A6A6SKS3_9PLEO|nr:hypothetical protein K491DRAFT_741649 [Lophiostoma macrostomum CBS 122681]